MPSARMIGIGAFVIGGCLLFAIALFMIGERQMLFTKQFEVYAQFARLAGLEEGATVQVSGLTAGEVQKIEIPTKPGAKFRVRLRIREDLHPLVRTDSVASIRTSGLVGSQFVMVTAGTERAVRAADGSTIPSREPFDIADLLEQAAGTIANVNQTITGLRTQIEATIANVASTVGDAEKLINDVGGDIRTIAASGAKVADDIATITDGIRQGRGTVGQLFTNDALYQRADSIAADAQQAAANVREASDSAKKLIDSWSKKGGPGEGLVAEFRDTLDKANATLSNLSQNTEALKHNWFFSGYFKRRGYYSLADISPEEYRRGAIEQSGRVKLRVWLEGSLLFARAPNGQLMLTDAGKTRLDSAMGEFLQYTGSGPLVVEGYAQAGMSSERYLESQQRASLVRSYLLGRFALNPDSVGVMPLGADAPGSPGGNNRWDGVALAVFVPKEAVRK